MRLARNLLAVLTQPQVAIRYAQLLYSGVIHRAGAVRRLPGRDVISGFSEFLNCEDYTSAAERSFLGHSRLGSGVIVDVGANLGIVSLILAKRFPDRKIHAFEPNPATFLTLTANLARNGCMNVQAHCATVVAHDVEVDFRQTHSNVGPNASSPVTLVRCVTLDHFAATKTSMKSRY